MPAVSGTWYEIFNANNCKIHGGALNVVWTVQPLTLDFRVTTDGVTRVWYQSNPASATWYYAKSYSFDHALDMQFSLDPVGVQDSIAEGHSILIEIHALLGTLTDFSYKVFWSQT